MLENYLLDNEFLASLDAFQHREVFARVTALTAEGKPIDYIEGKITQGSINVDGSSAVQRTCNLTMVTNNVDINNFYWGIKTQFKLETGLINSINPKYPDIIWFPQGVFIVVNFNTSISTNSCSITISGKDKMCMLNGDLGGNLPSSIDFGKEEFLRDVYIEKEFDNDYEYVSHTYYMRDGFKVYTGHFNPEQTYYVESGGNYLIYHGKEFYLNTTYYIENYKLATDEYNPSQQYYTKEQVQNKIDLPLKTIIREMIHAWGGEPYSNIIIKDLDIHGLEQLSWRSDTADLFCLRSINNDTSTNAIVTTVTPNQGKKVYLANVDITDGRVIDFNRTPIYLNELINGDTYHLISGTDSIISDNGDELTAIILSPSVNATPYHVMRITYGQDAGYRLCDLVYAGDLIANIGETCTSILDKIKTMLGDYEYFYNLEGQFVFQRKQTFVNTSWNSIEEMPGEKYVNPAELSSPVVYSFIGNKITTQISNNPQLNDAKNDYSVWGVRKGITDVEIPIHARYAIDKKPMYYKTIDGKTFATKEGWKYYTELMEVYTKPDENLGLIGFSRSSISKDIKVIDQNGKDCSDNWWDLKEWAEYYKYLTGNYPTGQANLYATTSFFGKIYFPSPSPDYNQPNTIYSFYMNQESEPYMTYDSNTYCLEFNNLHSTYGGGFIVDYYANNQGFESAEHGQRSCQHTYDYFLNAYNSSVKSLIYMPIIPDNTQYTATELQSDGYNFLFLKDPDYFVDWREIIYQMAKDYFKYSNSDIIDSETNQPVKDIFLQLVGERNPVFYPTGKTGYEQYYTDIEGFWRQLYNPGLEDEGAIGKQARPKFVWAEGYYDETKEWLLDKTGYHTVIDWTQASLEDLTVDYYCYQTPEELSYFTLEPETGTAAEKQEKIRRNNKRKELLKIYEERTIPKGEYSDKLYWNHQVFEAPETLNFWLDFLDDDTELASISRPVIGDRSKVVNDNKVTSIYFKQVPEFIFYSSNETISVDVQLEKKSAYTFISYDQSMEQCFSISYQGKSAKNAIDDLLYQHSYCTENISITSIPIYHLQPNTRIFVEDVETGISGEYIMTKFTIPLTYNGTMSITANKAPIRIY